MRSVTRASADTCSTATQKKAAISRAACGTTAPAQRGTLMRRRRPWRNVVRRTQPFSLLWHAAGLIEEFQLQAQKA